MKKLPAVHSAVSIVKDFENVGMRSRHPDAIAGMLPSRPEPFWPGGFGGLRQRISLAWAVFTGRYDALDWQQ